MDISRALTTAIAAGRIGIGLGLVAAPSKVGGSWIGRAAGTAPTQVAVRGLGIRDVALGAAMLGTMRATGTGGTGFAVLTGLSVLVDTVDTLTTASASAEIPGGGRMSMAVAGGAALGGLVALATRDTDA